MSKRLQVLLEESELREIQRVAHGQNMTVAEWVRQALRIARRREPHGKVEKKMDVLRAAVRHEFPTGDMDTILAEIERGYTGGSRD